VDGDGSVGDGVAQLILVDGSLGEGWLTCGWWMAGWGRMAQLGMGRFLI
jgi:hypothetical protein